MTDAAPQPAPMLPPGPVPADETQAGFQPPPEQHPLMPGEAPPQWQQPGPWQQPPNGYEQPPPGWRQGEYVQQPPPGWVGKWHPPVPPTPTDDPSTWPQMGVAPAAGANVGGWAKTATAVPEDQPTESHEWQPPRF